MTLTAQISRFLEPIRNRIRMVVQRALLSLVDDSTALQLLQVTVLKGDVVSQVERVQNYGLTSCPKADSEVLLLFVNGNRDQAIAVAVDSSAYRKKGLAEGEVALYDHLGNYVLLRSDEKIELGKATQSPTAGVVTGECLDPVTGVPFPDKSTRVLAQKL